MDTDAFEGHLRPRPSASRPLFGVTILVVEDSRYASEGLRLLSLRSGARIRRADSLTAARRHLAVYHPTVAIVDLGLPDGSGLDLLSELSATVPRIPVRLGLSGDEGAATAVRAAGADGFLAKPVESLASFQAAILEHLPRDLHPAGPRAISGDIVRPDELAFREDLAHAVKLLYLERPPVGYLRPFLRGVARAAGDDDLDILASEIPPSLTPIARQTLRRRLTARMDLLKAV